MSVSHPLFARAYVRWILPFMEKSGSDELRGRVLAGLSGTVVEVGAGSGANFARYPAAVERVIAVEPDAYLRARAEVAAAGDPRIAVADASAESLPATDGSADAVVVTWVLCSVADVDRAAREIVRVLRPGGVLAVLEHVLAHEPGPMRTVQRALDATVWPLLGGGCHCGRDTAASLAAAGFDVSTLERTRWPAGSTGPEASILVGQARSLSTQ